MVNSLDLIFTSFLSYIVKFFCVESGVTMDLYSLFP